MNTYYCELYPMGWFHVFMEGCNNFADEPCDMAGVMTGYKEAEARGHHYTTKNGVVTSIYIWNNGFWFKAKADSIKEFVTLFFKTLYGFE